jgi:antitoxin ParD1/3/4
MRTNIDIDDELMEQAMQAGPFKTKKDAVEAGLKLLARQVAYREILKWRGKLKWEGDESIDWTVPAPQAAPLSVQEPAPPPYVIGSSLQAHLPAPNKAGVPAKPAAPTGAKRRAGR